jgi:tetratricopeptide (TPR) repeat protein
LQIERGGNRDTRVRVMATLTGEAIWIQETWRLRPIPLRTLVVEQQRNGKELVLRLGPEPSTEKFTLAFAAAAEGQRWWKEIQSQQRLNAESPTADRQLPEGVALVRQVPEVPYVTLGRVGFTGPTKWAADRGLQLRAGIRGADAIIELHRQRYAEAGWGARHVSGIAVRVEDPDTRERLRLRWYGEELRALLNRILVALVIQAVLLFLLALNFTGSSPLQAATGETPSQALSSALWGMAILYAWPLIILILAYLVRWPQLIRTAGLVALVVMTGRGLIVWLGHVLAVWTTGTPSRQANIWILADPVEWTFIIAGVLLCVRAWRLADAAHLMLPANVHAAWEVRKVWARGFFASACAYGLALFAFLGIYRYQTSKYLLQPGIDPRREHQALLALNEGVAQVNRGDMAAAEQSFQRSLRLWEELTATASSPSVYRRNLAMTLNDLDWIRHQQGRVQDAERFYARAVSLADGLAGDPEMDHDFKETLDGARAVLAELRSPKLIKELEAKDREADRKYEEAQVKEGKAPADSERLYQEAIALWEEVLPHATNEDYRKGATARLAAAYLQLAEFQQQLRKRSAAEASLSKAIAYGEKAVTLDPERPLPKHNLAVAQQTLERMREQALQEEVGKLSQAERFADAVDLWWRGIEEQEERVRAGKNRDAAVRRLAYRLNQFAWFLAHCPDERVRNVKVAVKHARRAVELHPDVEEHWYTLAMVQYRNGDWSDSLASLEKVKAKAGTVDASDWFLTAMNLYQLKRREEARAALRKGVEWVDERKREAEDNPVLRIQYEMMRPNIEALRREAESLIEGKGPGNHAVG